MELKSIYFIIAMFCIGSGLPAQRLSKSYSVSSRLSRSLAFSACHALNAVLLFAVIFSGFFYVDWWLPLLMLVISAVPSAILMQVIFVNYWIVVYFMFFIGQLIFTWLYFVS